MKLARTLLCTFLLFILVSSLGLAALPEGLQIDQAKITLVLPKGEGQSYHVWHTTNPMKVIVDAQKNVWGRAQQIKVQDVALKVVRWSAASDGTARLVLEFDYRLPAPNVTETDDAVIVEVAKEYVETSEQVVSVGVRYGHQRRAGAAGPNIVNYLRIDALRPGVEVKLVLAQDSVRGRERVSSMAWRSQAIAAVNGAFFAGDGRPLGLFAIDGELVSEPYAKRTAIGLGPGFAVMDAVDFHGVARLADGSEHRVTGINRPRLQDDLIVYTRRYGTSTGTNVYGWDIVLVDGIVVGIYQGNADIPENGLVLSGHGAARDFLATLQVGDAVEVQLALEPDWFALGVEQIIGGGPRLVRDGIVHITGETELFQPDVLVGRAPRTALGFTADHKLLLVTVNGRQPGISVGMTLAELAELMIELGAVQAMNLDGGGSTTMVIRDRVLNLPSDGIERAVSNAIVVITPESRR
ncbi:MAG: phosphodiester glycosidase family protein [Firmicutes bacterium]|nr:phosphodiester glycosidase family protein [Bacillota bacterium]